MPHDPTPKIYFHTRCEAPACGEKFEDFSDEKLEQRLIKHFMEKHPERFFGKISLPMVHISRYNPDIIRRGMKYSEETQRRNA